MNSLDLLNAIRAGDSRKTQEVFETLTAERIENRIGELRTSIAQSMFSPVEESVELTEEEQKYHDMSDDEFEALVEGYEQLDELSKTTLQSYTTKAFDGPRSVKKLANAASSAFDAGNTKDGETLYSQATKRFQGTNRAIKKMNTISNKEILNKNRPLTSGISRDIASDRKVGLFDKLKAKFTK